MTICDKCPMCDSTWLIPDQFINGEIVHYNCFDCGFGWRE